MSDNKKHIRSKMQSLHEAGWSIKKISKNLRVSRNTVRLWVRSVEGNVSDAHRSGRPSKLSPGTKRKITALVKDRVGVGVRTVAKRLNFSQDFLDRHKTICANTVRNYVTK